MTQRLTLKVMSQTQRTIPLGWIVKRGWVLLLALLATLYILSHDTSTRVDGPRKEAPLSSDKEKGYIAAVCVHSAWGNQLRRNVFRSLWLSTESNAAGKIVYAFVVGLDNTMTRQEIQALDNERHHFGDIMIADRVEENYSTLARKTKYCVDYFVREGFDFEFFVKTDDDTIVFMDRLKKLMRDKLRLIPRVFFGYPHESVPVSNPNKVKDRRLDTDKYFEWRYQGDEWPLWMQGGLYGFSYELAKEVTELEDPALYISEDISASLWMYKLDANFWSFSGDRVLYMDRGEFVVGNSKNLLTVFQSDPVHMEALAEGTEMEAQKIDADLADVDHDLEQPRAVDAPNIEYFQSISFLRTGVIEPKETFKNWPRGLMLDVNQRLQDAAAVDISDIGRNFIPGGDNVETQVYLDRLWEAHAHINWDGQWEWWRNMEGSHRFQPGSALLSQASLDMYPLHLLQNLKWLALDDFHLQTSKAKSLRPTFYVVSPTTTREDLETWAPSAMRKALFSFLPCYASDDSITPVYEYIQRRSNVFWMCKPDENNRAIQSLFDVYAQEDMRIFSMHLMKWAGFNQIFIWGRVASMQADDFANMMKHMKRQGTRVSQIVMRKRSFHMPRVLLKQIQLVENIHLLMRSLPLSLWQLLIPKDSPTLATPLDFFSEVPNVNYAGDWSEEAKAQLADQVTSISHYREWMNTHTPYGPVAGYYLWVSRAFESISQKALNPTRLLDDL
eukprot:Clim_evm1s107 gene=Clim_evmTU1s107